MNLKVLVGLLLVVFLADCQVIDVTLNQGYVHNGAPNPQIRAFIPEGMRATFRFRRLQGSTLSSFNFYVNRGSTATFNTNIASSSATLSVGNYVDTIIQECNQVGGVYFFTSATTSQGTEVTNYEYTIFAEARPCEQNITVIPGTFTETSDVVQGWRYYRFIVPESNTYSLTAAARRLSGSATDMYTGIYLRQDLRPTVDFSDYRFFGWLNDRSMIDLTVKSCYLSAGEWYIGLQNTNDQYRYWRYEFSFKLELDSCITNVTSETFSQNIRFRGVMQAQLFLFITD